MVCKVDSRNSVRETCKKIIELSKDKAKLREERIEAAKIRKKLALGGTYKNELFKNTNDGETASFGGTSSSKKMMVVDEDAYFTYHEKKGLQKKVEEEMSEKSPDKPYDKQSEPNLAKKLGLANETDQTIIKKENSKKSKEDLEKEVSLKSPQKDMQEVEKIIAEGGGLNDINKFMKEVDLLELDLDVGCSKTPAQNNGAGKGSFFLH